MPFNQRLGFRVVKRHRDGVTLECALRPDMLNGAGLLHGGVTATLADAAAGFAIWNHFGGRRRATTAEMKINYLRPVGRGKIVARSRLARAGSTLCVSQVDVRDAEGRLAAVALVTYMLLPQSAAAGKKHR